MIHIGIDPGTKTGLAVWSSTNKELMQVETMQIHKALFFIAEYTFPIYSGEVKIWLENPNKAKQPHAKHKLKGAGSICRDFAIWRDFLNDYKIEWQEIDPRHKGKLYQAFGVKTNKVGKPLAKSFNEVTGWQGRASEHAREAALFVYKR